MKPALQVHLTREGEKQVQGGVPWVMKHMLQWTSELELAPPGSLAELIGNKGEFLGIAYVNPLSFITARVLTRKRETIGAEWFAARFRKALAAREEGFRVPYYRLVHAEADGLPGLLVERFGDIVSVQSGTAGMDRLQPEWIAAIETVLSPTALILRNDTPSRKSEGLAMELKTVKGSIPPRVEVLEHGTRYVTDLSGGQKTGWYYDMRANRHWVAARATGKTMLDVYCNAGGFGIAAARAGATRVRMIDRSALALELAEEAAGLNNVNVEIEKAEAFAAMEALVEKPERWDIVVADPPPFVKSRKDVASGMKGYRKVARLAAKLAAPGGAIFIASCSHHADKKAFHRAVLEGIGDANRKGSISATMGADADHPVHPQLPQSEYLKAAWIQLD